MFVVRAPKDSPLCISHTVYPKLHSNHSKIFSQQEARTELPLQHEEYMSTKKTEYTLTEKKGSHKIDHSTTRSQKNTFGQ